MAIYTDNFFLANFLWEQCEKLANKVKNIMIRNIFKSGAEKSKKDVPGNKNLDTENPKTGNDEMNEELSATESAPDDASMSQANDDTPISVENDDTPMSVENDDNQNSHEDTELEEVAEAGAEKADEELIALQNKLAELQDKYIRLAAEYDNYRKRTLREKAELIQTAGETLLKDILPVIDDFDRGLEVAANADDMDAVRVGMGLIYNKLKEFLTNNGVKEIDAMNEPFDTDWHEAVTNIPAPSDDMKGMIVDVIQKGYMLHSKVIRYPKVVVGE